MTKLTIAYDGTAYLGWQTTIEGPSIQSALETALFNLFQTPIQVVAASRTDRGVHARGQVVHFSMPKPFAIKRLPLALNFYLPEDIRILSAEEAPISFHATLSCTAKEYHYQIFNGPLQLPFDRKYSWHIPLPLDIKKMRQAAIFLIGKQDFSSFCNARSLLTKSPECEIFSIEIDELALHRIRMRLLGNRFLYKMGRNLSGILAYVGSGKVDPSHLPEILEKKDRRHAGITAPACGLTLHRVFYTQLT